MPQEHNIAWGPLLHGPAAHQLEVNHLKLLNNNKGYCFQHLYK